jgi:hypothetical protein
MVKTVSMATSSMTLDGIIDTMTTMLGIDSRQATRLHA